MNFYYMLSLNIMLLSKGDILIPISLLLYFKEICADALVIGRYWKHLRRYIMVSIFIVTHKHKQEKRTANKKHKISFKVLLIFFSLLDSCHNSQLLIGIGKF